MATDKPLIMQLNGVRLARLSITTPYIGKDAAINAQTGKPEGKYHSDLILDENDPQLAQAKAQMRDAVIRKFADQSTVVIEQIVANNKLPLHRGNVDRAGKPEYKDKLYFSASNSDQPNIVVTENGAVIGSIEKPLLVTPAHPQYPYAGCYANAIISFFAYSHPKGGKGVSCQLMALQFVRHGERLKGSSVASASEFKPISGADVDGAAPPAAAPQGGAGLI